MFPEGEIYLLDNVNDTCSCFCTPSTVNLHHHNNDILVIEFLCNWFFKFWAGDVVLKDLKLKAEALNSLNLPVTVKAGFVGTITLKVVQLFQDLLIGCLFILYPYFFSWLVWYIISFIFMHDLRPFIAAHFFPDVFNSVILNHRFPGKVWAKNLWLFLLIVSLFLLILHLMAGHLR